MEDINETVALWIAEMRRRPWVSCVDVDDSGCEVALAAGWSFAGSGRSVATWDRVWGAIVGTQFVNVRYRGDEHLRGYTAVAKGLVDGDVYVGQAVIHNSLPNVYHVGRSYDTSGAASDFLLLRGALSRWVLAVADGDEPSRENRTEVERYATRFAFWASDGRRSAIVDAWQYAGDTRIGCYAADISWHDSYLSGHVRDRWARYLHGVSDKLASGTPRCTCRLTYDKGLVSVAWGNCWYHEWSV